MVVNSPSPKMSRNHFKYAADRIVSTMAANCLGIQSLDQLDIYKEYLQFFLTFSHNFAKDKFDQYIIQKLNGK